MATSPRWPRSSRRLSVLLLAVVVPPAAALVWLGARLVAQDQALVLQRATERREAAARIVRQSLDRSLAEAASHLTDGALPDGLVRLTVFRDRATAEPSGRTLWTPIPQPGLEADPGVFTAAETAEFSGDDVSALAAYASLARSSDTATRAGALLRVARIHRRAGRVNAALTAYRSLALIQGVSIDGAPTDLQARRAEADILHTAGRPSELAPLAASLERDLVEGRWALRIDRALWDVAVGDIKNWTGRDVPASGDRRGLSLAIDEVWNDRRESGAARSQSAWTIVGAADFAVPVLGEVSGTQFLLVAPSRLTEWLDAARRELPGPPASLALLDAAGERRAGTPPASDLPVMTLGIAETGLPWTLVTTGDATAPVDIAARRRLLAGGVIAILLLFAGTTLFFWTVMRRDLALARQQSEFVAAVSHEFRTPLTSLRHVTELLNEGEADLSTDERRTFYRTLERSTERLRRLVESLLDFSRLEAGRRPYDLQLIDAGGAAAEVVAEFEGDASSHGVRVQLTQDAGGLPVMADREAFGHALWNLLDNAVKYSPTKAAVSVSVTRGQAGVALAVTDSGLGIPADERQGIFGRFVRGRTASHLGIGGTGLGLAIVAHIVDAHRGAVAVESTEGVGSTFTITLPLAGETAAAADLQPQRREA